MEKKSNRVCPVNEIKGEWLTEKYNCSPSISWSIPIEQVLYQQSSKSNQDVFVFKSHGVGTVLAINGKIQICESDEFNYHEFLAHVPLNCHPNPQHVLIVGGGIGGLTREALKHKSIETVTVVELDETVVDVSEQFFPQVSCKLSDPRVRLHIRDGVEYIKDCTHEYDVILIEISPDESDELRTKQFWQNVKRLLRPEGIVVNLSDDVFYGVDEVKKSIVLCRDVFPSIAFAYAFVPSYCGGQGMLLYSSKRDLYFSKPLREFNKEDIDDFSLRYYNSEMHRAAFAIPEYARQMIAPDALIFDGLMVGLSHITKYSQDIEQSLDS